ncbi:MAG TPA: L-alanine exporter AlaE [Candidatus Nanoarchaeia archaeon]|nr:L-alanine exporter AlaE [Candidatus Nanoarchaeia archaeon]
MEDGEKNLEKRITDEPLSNELSSHTTDSSSLYNSLTTVLDKHREGIRNYLIDTSAAVTFSLPLSVTIEHYIADMENEQVLRTRMCAIAAHLLLGRPYGKFRDWWAKTLHVDASSHRLAKYLTDSSARLLYQIPVYPVVLFISGADWEKGKVAYPTSLAIGAVTGIAYGYCLDLWRKFFGAKPTLRH